MLYNITEKKNSNVPIQAKKRWFLFINEKLILSIIIKFKYFECQ